MLDISETLCLWSLFATTGSMKSWHLHLLNKKNTPWAQAQAHMTICTCRWSYFSLVLLLVIMWRKHLRSVTSSQTTQIQEQKVRLSSFFPFLFSFTGEVMCPRKMSCERKFFPHIWFLWFYSKEMLYFKRHINKEFHNLIPERLIILILRWFLNIMEFFFEDLSWIPSTEASPALHGCFKQWLTLVRFGCVNARFHLYSYIIITLNAIYSIRLVVFI